jgi:CheY-like chemotaxis protein/HPt (histidine-containing phosphotransfer) domain-containing protein
MDGLETIKKIRENFQTSVHLQPIILLYSSSDDDKILKACEEYKVNYRLVKPIKMNDLYQAFYNLNAKNGKKKTESDAEKTLNISNPKILVAEDNSVNMLLSKTLIKKAIPNAIIIEAKNGQEAIDKYQAEFPALIFMDIQMPLMNGYEATEAIRALALPTHTPIIALTAGNVKGEREKCIELGMDDFIVKPITQASIYEVLKKWLIITEDKADLIGMNEEERVHFNKNTIRNLVDHNEEMVEELLIQLNIELNNYKLEINQQLKNTDIQTCKNIGHKVYGMASSIGMEVLADMAKEIEIMELNPTQMKERLLELNAEFELLLNLI